MNVTVPCLWQNVPFWFRSGLLIYSVGKQQNAFLTKAIMISSLGFENEALCRFYSILLKPLLFITVGLPLVGHIFFLSRSEKALNLICQPFCLRWRKRSWNLKRLWVAQRRSLLVGWRNFGIYVVRRCRRKLDKFRFNILANTYGFSLR